MMQIESFSLKDIIISEDFGSTTPAAMKLDKVRGYVADHGELPAYIVINNDNVLIDGYCTYLVALELGADRVPVREDMLSSSKHHTEQAQRISSGECLQGSWGRLKQEISA